MGRKKKKIEDKLTLLQTYVLPRDKEQFEQDASEEGTTAAAKLRTFVVKENKKNKRRKE